MGEPSLPRCRSRRLRPSGRSGFGRKCPAVTACAIRLTVFGMRPNVRTHRRLAVEAVAFGLGYAGVLCWASVCLVATFGGTSLASPYWPSVPWLRTDTTGVIAFGLAAAGLVVSKYLRLRRTSVAAVPEHGAGRSAASQGSQAIAETAALLATALVAYLSLNVVTHSVTLGRPLTHLVSWPSEGTVRVIALGICLVSVAATRYLRSVGRSGASNQLPPGDHAGPGVASRTASTQN
jgi:hypothetical protein